MLNLVVVVVEQQKYQKEYDDYRGLCGQYRTAVSGRFCRSVGVNVPFRFSSFPQFIIAKYSRAYRSSAVGIGRRWGRGTKQTPVADGNRRRMWQRCLPCIRRSASSWINLTNGRRTARYCRLDGVDSRLAVKLNVGMEYYGQQCTSAQLTTQWARSGTFSERSEQSIPVLFFG